jgi:hypothetical protein
MGGWGGYAKREPSKKGLHPKTQGCKSLSCPPKNYFKKKNKKTKKPQTKPNQENKKRRKTNIKKFAPIALASPVCLQHTVVVVAWFLLSDGGH